MLDENLNIIGSSKDNPRVTYNWDKNFAYVPAAYFIKVNVVTITVPDKPNTTPDNSNNQTTPNEPEPPKNEEIPKEEEKPKPKEISAIVTEASYKYENGNISGITPGTSIETIKNKLTNTGGIITITDVSGKAKETGNIGTGDKVNITSGITETLTVLIYGDTNGDGTIDKLDASSVLRQYYGYDKYEGIYSKALDVNKDGAIDKLDASSILRSYYGYDSIKQ